MSRQDASEEKTVIKFEDQPILSDLELPELIASYKRAYTKHFEWGQEVTRIKEELGDVVQAVKADTVVYRDWKATYVPPGKTAKLVKRKLVANMMKIGRIDAATADKILQASMQDSDRAGYTKITAPDGELPKKAKDEEEGSE